MSKRKYYSSVIFSVYYHANNVHRVPPPYGSTYSAGAGEHFDVREDTLGTHNEVSVSHVVPS